MSDVVTKSDVTTKARELLVKNKGLFVGEQHGNLLASGFIQSNRAMLKEEHVTTLFMETSIYLAEAYQGGRECIAAFFNAKPYQITNSANSFLAIVEAAQASGIRVIGHDSVNKSAWLFKSGSIKKIIETPAIYDSRDDYAAALIKSMQDGGKYIVYGGARHSKDDPERPSGIGLSTRLGIPSINFWEPVAFYSNEGLISGPFGIASSYVQFKAQQNAPLHMREGKDRESTYKVTSWNDNVFAQSPSYQLTPAEAQKILALQDQAKDSGACKPPPNQEKIYLDSSDIENLAKHMKKPDTALPPRR